MRIPWPLKHTEGEDYVIPVTYSVSAVLDAITSRDCRTVELRNDDLLEDTESFIFRLTLSSGPFDVIGNFQVSVPETTVVILDDDTPGTCITVHLLMHDTTC